MEKNENKIVSVTVGLAITIGIAFNEFLSQYPNIPFVANLIITFIVSVSVHEFLYWLITKLINHFDFLLKLYWGKTYIKGYWSYTYIINNEKKIRRLVY